MEVISIDPKQVSMMVGTEVCRTLLQTMYKEAPSSLSARRTAMKDNEMVFGADGGGCDRRSYSPTTAGTRPPQRRPARLSAPSRARAMRMTPSSRCA